MRQPRQRLDARLHSYISWNCSANKVSHSKFCAFLKPSTDCFASVDMGSFLCLILGMGSRYSMAFAGQGSRMGNL